VEFTGELLSVELGPGLLARIFDGLQNPLPELAEQTGFFLHRGTYLPALDRARTWSWTPSVQPGDRVVAGDALGTVPEGIFTHRIMVPFGWSDEQTVVEVAPAGERTVEQVVARLRNSHGVEQDVTLLQRWPVRLPIRCFDERLRPAGGGTYCIPGPFGAGKTVLQQITSRHADVDIVIIAACGERAGEVVETLRTFPELPDPRTGRSLMERTLIICNTSSMPVAAREASVYTAVTIAEYYRQMALNVLLLADSTSRFARGLRAPRGDPGRRGLPGVSRIGDRRLL